MSRLRKLQETAAALLFDRGPEHADSARHASRVYRALHFWARVVHSFLRNRCPVHASALAFSSLLGLIPILAVAFSVSTLILKSQDQGEAQVRLLVGKIIETVSPYTGGASPAAHDLARAKQEEAVQKIHEFIRNTQSKTIGGVGMLAFVLVAITMLRRIEATFNDIWGVTRGRTWYTQVVLYWAVISLGPILLMLALGLTGSAQFAATREWLMHWPWLGGMVFRSLPLLVLMGLFTMLYQMMPNTRVHPGAALAGSLVAGLLWQGNSLLGVLVATRITQNNAIYGSLGMVPVLMIGLYFSWLILLFGAQVAYAFQNRKAYLQDRQAESVNQRGRELAALRVMVLVARQFAAGAPAPGLNQLAHSLAVPSRLVSQVLQSLLRAQLVVETNERAPGYVPARALDRITAQHILQSIRSGRGQDLAPAEDSTQAGVLAAFERINAAEQAVAGQLTLQDLVQDAR
jgi:membrane protein